MRNLILKGITLILIMSLILPVNLKTMTMTQTNSINVSLMNYVEVMIVEGNRKGNSWIRLGSIGRGKVAIASITPLSSSLNLSESCIGCSSCYSNNGSMSLQTNTLASIESRNRKTSLVQFIEAKNGKGTEVLYLLLHTAGRKQYNVTVVTHIFTNPENPDEYLLFRTVANIYDKEKEVFVANLVMILNKTSLADHYLILSRTLRKLANIEKEMNQAWNLLAGEFEYLSVLVKSRLNKYDKEAYGFAVLFDGPWRWLCVLICNIACAAGCGAGTALICGAACAKPCAGCTAILGCPACIACIVLCGGITGSVCQVISMYGCAPGCDWICEKAGW